MPWLPAAASFPVLALAAGLLATVEIPVGLLTEGTAVALVIAAVWLIFAGRLHSERTVATREALVQAHMRTLEQHNRELRDLHTQQVEAVRDLSNSMEDLLEANRLALEAWDSIRAVHPTVPEGRQR